MPVTPTLWEAEDYLKPAVQDQPGQHILARSEEHTSELQSPCNLVCRLLLEKKNEYRPGIDATPTSTVSFGAPDTPGKPGPAVSGCTTPSLSVCESLSSIVSSDSRGRWSSAQ